MQMPAPVRTPGFLSRRRLFEQKLEDLHKCTDLNQLKQLHALIYKSNLHKDPYVAPKLISALSLCRRMSLAVTVFDQFESPNAHVCNALIRAHVRNSEPDKAFEVFCEMMRSGISPDNYSYLFLLKACTRFEFVGMIHAHVEKYNLYSDLFLPNSLIDAYSKCGSIGVRAAKAVFDSMETRDVVTYNSMINGLVRAGELDEARKLFDEMPQRDMVSWNAILNGYVKAGEMAAAFEIFQEIPSRDVVSWSTLISGYVNMGDLEMAKMLFDKMPVKNLVTWTIMVSGYAEKGLAKEAIKLFNQMKETRLKFDDASIVSILSACAESGFLALGKRVHRFIHQNRYNCSTMTSNVLIDMYCKCGSLSSAQRVFEAMGSTDLISWNVMIHGMAMHGCGQKALCLFEDMKKRGFTPDKVTFVGVLSACNHSGLINDGLQHFYSMKSDYNIAPEIEHYGCMIDLLGRKGRLSEAFRLLYDMPFEPNVVIWSSLLAACRMHNSVEFADEILKLKPTDAGNCTMLSNMYAAMGNWGSAANERLQMKITAGERSAGVSSVQSNGELHEFSVMDTTHPKSDKIYLTLDGLNQHVRKVLDIPSFAS